jgi:predicted DNA-binding transcriptional regulator YafY
MKAFEQLERLKRMNRLIKEERTGTPEEFATRLNIGRRRLYELLDDFREMGVLIEYSKLRNTYYYKNGHEIELNFSFKVITRE